MKEIKAWRKATEDLAKVFVKKYFPDEVYEQDCFWVGDRIGDVFFVADMWLDLNRMIEALELDATWEQLREYDDLELEHAMKKTGKPTPINFRNFVKYGKEIK